MINLRSETERAWRNLIDYIDSRELFIPARVESKLKEDAHGLFGEFMDILVERRMLVRFQKRGFFYRLAFLFHRIRVKRRRGGAEMLNVYLKGPRWEEGKKKSFAEVNPPPEQGSAQNNN